MDNLSPSTHFRRSHAFSRRSVVVGGAIASFSSAIALAGLTPSPVGATPKSQRNSDADILNKALYYEHQAIWAYGAAAGKLSDTKVGQTVKALALRNQADHIAHRDILISAIRQLNATPVAAERNYDLSSYLQRGEGALDSDINIAKLALALETDAAIAYTTEIAQLSTPGLITAGASIGSNESAHATAIRAAFIALGVAIDFVPASFVSAETRNLWVLKV
jgi:rubrerythrin